MEKKMTKQRRWQIKMVKEGRCYKCGKPAEKGKKMCRTHLDADNKRQRGPKPPRYDKVYEDGVKWLDSQ